jgi:hypothetical protein
LKVELLPLKKEGEATVNPPAQSPCTLCPESGPKKNQLADTSLLKRRSQGGRTSQGFTLVYWIPQEHKHTPTGKEPREKSDGEPKERGEKAASNAWERLSQT